MAEEICLSWQMPPHRGGGKIVGPPQSRHGSGSLIKQRCCSATLGILIIRHQVYTLIRVLGRQPSSWKQLEGNLRLLPPKTAHPRLD